MYYGNINRQVEERISRLFEAVETGMMPLDDLLQKRVTQLRTARDALQVELANIKESATVPVERILASDVDQFAQWMRLKLKDQKFAKRYLTLLVDEITVDQTTAMLTGSYRKLTHTIVETKMGTSDEVPISMSHWRARSDSNARPLGS